MLEVYGGSVWNDCNTTFLLKAASEEEAADGLWWMAKDKALTLVRQALQTGKPVLAGYVWPDGLQTEAPPDREVIGTSRYGDPVYAPDAPESEADWAPAIEPYYIEVFRTS